MSFQSLREGFVNIFQSSLQRCCPLNLQHKQKAVEIENIINGKLHNPTPEKRAAYIQRCEELRRALERPYGDFLETTLGEQLMFDKLTPSEVLIKCTEPYNITPRQRYQSIFYKVFANDNRFTNPKNYAIRLERSCYNQSIKMCTQMDAPIIRSWDSEEFVAIYSSRCGTILCNLDPTSCVCRAHGIYALDQLASGSWSPDNMGKYQSAELCPAAAIRERAEITLRSQQIINEKTSQLYRCPSCRTRNCTYREVQTRALDEPATIFCTCKNCGTEFTG
jgi:DNA-directed RNA polymerase subunit M/transcription elongation factor TFIIS